MPNREECRANAYVEYLGQQTDLGLACIFYTSMSKLVNKDFGVKYFDKKRELIQMITELDFTGELDMSGFEDIRNLI